jgi:hypothetical protein
VDKVYTSITLANTSLYRQTETQTAAITLPKVAELASGRNVSAPLFLLGILCLSHYPLAFPESPSFRQGKDFPLDGVSKANAVLPSGPV